MKKPLVISILILVILGAISWLIFWMHMPAEGSVSHITPSGRSGAAPYNKKLDGTYVSFQHSSEYMVRSVAPSNNDLERYTLNASTQYSKQIIASVVRLPEGQLKSNGDFLYRLKSPEVYTSHKFHTSSGIVDVWVRKDGTEQTAMVPHGDKAAILSLITAPGANIDLTPEMDTLLKTLEWKQ
jgi:hypothetical protein